MNPGSSSTDKKSNLLELGFWIVASSLILLVAFTKHPVSLIPDKDVASKLSGILGSLLVVSLLVERVIEVFVSIWRNPASDVLEKKLDNLQDRQATRKAEIDELKKETAESTTTDSRKEEIGKQLDLKRKANEQDESDEFDVKEQLVPFEARTRRLSTWVGMTIGCLTALVGFRFLNQIVDVSTIVTARPGQYRLFIFVDVLLTGAILAGGSKTIHRLFTLYDTFMQSTRDKADKARNR